MAAKIIELPSDLNVNLEPLIHAQLARRAKAAGMSKQALVHLVLRDFLAQPREWYWREVGRQQSDQA